MQAYAYQAALLCESCGRKTQDELANDWGTSDDGQTVVSPKGTRFDSATGDIVDGRGNVLGTDTDTYPAGPYPDGGGESDCPSHCDGCDLFLQNPLSDCGLLDVQESIARAVAEILRRPGPTPSVALQQWMPYYRSGIDLEDVAQRLIDRALRLLDPAAENRTPAAISPTPPDSRPS